MERYGVKPVKSLGQNFLADANIVRKIAELSELGPDDVVCEIGPGLGALTTELASRAGRVIAVEKDARIIPALEHALAGEGAAAGSGSVAGNVNAAHADFFDDNLRELPPGADSAAGNVSIIHADFLEYDLGELPPGYKLTGNLPYYITTPAIMKAVESQNKPSLIVFMTQREVARRICASPGGKDYGAVSVAVQYRCDTKYAMDVSREVFIPKPNVDSAVIALKTDPGHRGVPKNEALFTAVVKNSFGQRRKMLRNSLSSLVPDADSLSEAFDKAGVKGTARAETLSVEEFVALADAIGAFEYILK
ncbi:MAG: 16S rRNA (adenine(1518)-N(6)/adenine(1519)-N(6))-dimethyltransferase RsmA [Clostridiales Family XIII bacterium]|jgi:16S rRNA (adenine1518-N6/adenine1519-N6)-dimethyltransferase|nr:16S rRNA (adenine(1518)-N(6)/adenine(1519)-N(6))-dimethyltransferase RsmA [Clostridiales Family XIII bacterium]